MEEESTTRPIQPATTMKLTLITIAIGLPLSLILIPKLGIIGLLITNLAAESQV